MKLQFIGGASTVTGSCFYLQTNNMKFLVDCGMHQGNGADEMNRRPLAVPLEEIEFILVTHAHMDHSGLLPRVVRDGFKGRIITTQATRDLLEPMLYDSAAIQESDAAWETKKGMRLGKEPVEPLYTSEDVTSILPRFDLKPYNKVFHLGNGVKCRFIDAGHILGSASLEIWFQDSAKEKKIVFSGDIGKSGSPIIKDPSTASDADYVVMESTYGNRTHRPIEESINELVDAIKTTFKRGGNVYIPSFAVGRAQDLLFIINDLVRTGRLYKIDVYLDSPLAEEVTRVYASHPECFDAEAKELFSARERDYSMRLHFVRTVEESMRLNSLRGGSIIIAGSGMCDGGRIKHHLKHNIWRHDCGVIFVGYQAKHTLGRRIVDGARTVNILGEEVMVKAAIHTINGFSAHADRNELLAWLTAIDKSPKVFIVHGEDASADALKELIKARLGLDAHRPKDDEVVEL
ncbi:MAG: MBL fold metallo-hydrolase [Deltaproteobacteria bacterium]|nr:MBL fold metallo-hydrolase [Deltaproteobacteria bacterium]